MLETSAASGAHQACAPSRGHQSPSSSFLSAAAPWAPATWHLVESWTVASSCMRVADQSQSEGAGKLPQIEELASAIRQGTTTIVVRSSDVNRVQEQVRKAVSRNDESNSTEKEQDRELWQGRTQSTAARLWWSVWSGASDSRVGRVRRSPTALGRLPSPRSVCTMSSISFPHSGHSGMPSSSASEDSFYAPAFEGASSGFQMNPLSSHPPRTPRTSIISSSTKTYGGEIYTPKDEAFGSGPPEPEEYVEIDAEDEAVKKRAQRIRKAEVWKEMLKSSQGRDKAFVRQ